MSMSQLLPEVSRWLNETPRAEAWPSEKPSAPDWLIRPMLRRPRSGGGASVMKVMMHSRRVFTVPMQFGPTIRMPLSREIAASRSCCATRSGRPTSE